MQQRCGGLPARVFIKTALIVIFCAWFSFFSQPVQEHYLIGVEIALGVFLLGLLWCEWSSLKEIFTVSDWPFWVFLLCLSCGLINATDKALALRTYSYLILTAIFVFYAGKLIARSERNIVLFNVSISVCAFIVAIFGILEALFRYNPLYAELIPNQYYARCISGTIARPMSTLLNPTPLATYLLCALVFGILLFKEQNRAKRLLGYASVAASSCCLALTLSRAAFISLIVMSAMYFLLTKQYRRLSLLCVSLFLVSSMLCFASYPFSRFSLQGIAFYAGGILHGGRIIRMEMSAAMLKIHPFCGVGLNHFRILFDRFYPFKSQLPFLLQEVKIPDNMYFTLLAETGLIGIAGFFIFLVSLLSRGMKKYRRIKDEGRKQSVLLLACVFTGLLVSMTGYELFYWFTPYALFCLVGGFLSGVEYS